MLFELPVSGIQKENCAPGSTSSNDLGSMGNTSFNRLRAAGGYVPSELFVGTCGFNMLLSFSYTRNSGVKIGYYKIAWKVWAKYYPCFNQNYLLCLILPGPIYYKQSTYICILYMNSYINYVYELSKCN